MSALLTQCLTSLDGNNPASLDEMNERLEGIYERNIRRAFDTHLDREPTTGELNYYMALIRQGVAIENLV
ncbi:MAG: hypothetical protein HRT44_12865, partial [Bdellovibrionales bacterium]|nr:hypothetical protein [Bdellovibrionales bacterium]NQZ20128.1 hypothetical protein [Bdellovibrionales bacterium]